MSLFRMFQRRGLASQWEQANTVLAAGEIGLAIDVDIVKIGDGLTAWNDLPAISGDPSAAGAAFNFKGYLVLESDLPQAGNSVSDAFVIQNSKNLHVWQGASWINVGSILGPRGQAGPAGPQGIKGDVGLKGDRGIPGSTGSVGPEGNAGPPGPKGDRGLAGSVGLTGPQGSVGAQGQRGPTGPKGDTGLTGNIGLTGPRGLMGRQGVPGPTGPMGKGLAVKGVVANEQSLPPSPNAPADAYIAEDSGHLWIWSGTAWLDSGEVRGPGVAAGGLAGNVLIKSSNHDYETVWSSVIDGGQP